MSMANEQNTGYTVFYGNEVASTAPPRTQVWYATHLNTGDRSDMMYRSFISFMWGGKHIEDFNLIAITTNNAIQRNVSAEFSNLTTDLEVVDGQLYWGSHYNSNILDLVLYTDEITEKQLVSFQNWFKPNVERELILAEHPNRAIMARVSEVPQYSFLPFEKKITRTFGSITKETSTTMYKGSINLKFEMDDPFWYSINNYLEEKSGEIGSWSNPSLGQIEDINSSREAFKIIEEDGVPFSGMMEKDVHFGTESEPKRTANHARTASEEEINNSASIIEEKKPPEIFVGYAQIGGKVEGIQLINDITLTNGGALYYYYTGTAPSKPILEFNMRVRFDSEQLYIIEPANSYSKGRASSYNNKIQERTYNTITLKGPSDEYTHNFSFTSPSILTAYNQAVEVLMKAEPDKNGHREITDMVELREAIYDNVHHQLIRDAVFMELRDETNINNIIPRGIAFALRRLFRYKPNDGVACNMMHYFRLKLLAIGDSADSDYGKSFSEGATMTTVLYELVRMVVNHLSVKRSQLPTEVFGEYTAEEADQLYNIYDTCSNLLRNDDANPDHDPTFNCEVNSESGHARLKKVVQVLDAIINNNTSINISEISFKNTVVNVSRGGSTVGNGGDNSGVLPIFKFKIDSKTGRVITNYGFRIRSADKLNEPSYAYVRKAQQTTFDDDGAFNVTQFNEEAGDMVRSEYLTLDGQNQLNKNGLVIAVPDHPEYSYIMTHDLDMAAEDNMSNVKLLYRYMYY